ncbi:hypothetical protein D3Y57_01350 (plasmid) [Sphingomonas paeninsulae]|jgi:hypothetical protein|uniref:Uncharacterized protein n=1 Tax=Sphingomonas paeninsulae TaxID=2319844 RepID=A0A494TC02_SPHPE|nr:hypothetical protein [Sphingomonas paeninsulae]AYJ84774.1 hypothetical protein D3Y57_01350 [Sphingomonas paeninsulae]
MLRTFLSVDMVGSTLFKARYNGEGSHGWLETFRTFFTNFPLMFAGQIGFEFLDNEDSTPAFDVWKVMGDEVIFVIEPGTAEELTSVLCALLRTMKLFEQRHFQELPLRLKGTAWIADFNGHNIELDIPELSASESARHVDYIGPDIDLGFRLSKYARPASLTLSFDVVDILLGATNADSIALYLVGREPLKGVMFERPYPIIWMRQADEEFDFLPWEIEQCGMMAAAIAAQPTPRAALQGAITDMRHYLRKMHGIIRPAFRIEGHG